MWGKAQTMVMLGQFAFFSCCVWPIAWRLPETGDQQQDDVLRHDPNVGTASGKHCVAILSFTVQRHPKHQKMPLELEIHGGKKKQTRNLRVRKSFTNQKIRPNQRSQQSQQSQQSRISRAKPCISSKMSR